MALFWQRWALPWVWETFGVFPIWLMKTEGAPFFSEILRVPKTGEEDLAVERFAKLEVVKEFVDKDFNEPLLQRKVSTQAIRD